MRAAVLGSMPGGAALAARQYYAHPRNSFWPLMAELFGVDAGAPYARRLRGLRARGVGLWDVLASCERAGSLDQAIVRATAVLNELEPWLAGKQLRAVALNGQLAAGLFRRHAAPRLAASLAERGVAVLALPSTSPANARGGYPAKLAAWRRFAAAVTRD
ncbi:MAG: DNA-deoxyinosine glycosylase [Betaproteobacteria bacterium AqS2]|uniref:DNA-deoxyinosine glycosylase n=1 Tax=Candidatus Amphirhobacter heronislandensis TaxID=1732024 RepID=A0A930Y2A2_9GAMM|nr:DNA-deoxyinosine glycosylase [Betaproteobacteria bacterium AqS2]